jgi:hypothetical protein
MIIITKLREWWADERGLETAEIVVLLGGVLLPVVYFLMQIVQAIARFYEITSWITTLPFP